MGKMTKLQHSGNTANSRGVLPGGGSNAVVPTVPKVGITKMQPNQRATGFTDSKIAPSTAFTPKQPNQGAAGLNSHRSMGNSGGAVSHSPKQGNQMAAGLNKK